MSRIVRSLSLLSAGLFAAACGPTQPSYPGGVDPVQSSVALLSSGNLLADGVSAAGVRVTVRGPDGAPLAGLSVTLLVDGDGALVTQPAAPTDAAGMAEGSVRATRPGVKRISARVDTDEGPVTLDATPDVMFNALTASRLAVGPVTDGVAGTALPAFQVEVQDALGRRVTDHDVRVTLAIGSGPQGTTLGGTVEAQTQQGVATFNDVVIERAASLYTLVARTNSLAADTSDAFAVASAAPVRLVITGLPDEVSAGSRVQIGVEARDAFDNVASGFTGTVRLTDAHGELLADETPFTAADAGRRTFQVILRTAGEQSVTATDLSSPPIAADTRPIAVLRADGRRFVVVGLPAQVVAGVEQSLRVTVDDGFGNLDAGYTGTARFTSDDPNASMPDDTPFTVADLGSITVPVTFRGAGTRTLRIADVDDASVVALVPTSVQAAGVKHLQVEVPPAAVAGVPFAVAVTLADPFENVATDYAGTVRITDGGEPAVVLAEHAFTPEDKGARTLSVTLAVSGSNALVVEEMREGGLRTVRYVNVKPGPAATLVLSGPDTPWSLDQPARLLVEAFDAAGNVATGYTGTVGLSSTGAAAPLAHTFTPADFGRHSFELTFDSTGIHEVLAEDVSAGLSARRSVEVVVPEPTRLAFLREPRFAVAGFAMDRVVVHVTDDWGNLAAFDGTITLSLKDQPAGTLKGTTSVQAVGGAASFTDLRIDEEGTGLVLVAAAADVASAQSQPFNVNDIVPPADPGLQAGAVTRTSVELKWTTPGDDEDRGRAASYELRWAEGTEPLTRETFDSATQVPGLPTPKEPGEPESVVVDGLRPATSYAFALAVDDGARNVRFVSIVVSTVDPCGPDVCPVREPTCSSDGSAATTWTARCVLDDLGEPTCEDLSDTVTCDASAPMCVAGACVQPQPPQPGELFVEELMHSPSAGTTPYIEFSNPTDHALDLSGHLLSFFDGTTTRHVTLRSSPPLVIAPGGRLVLAHNADVQTNGGVPAEWGWNTDLGLSARGLLSVMRGVTLVLQLQMDESFPQSPGRALERSHVVAGTDTGNRGWFWCDSVGTLASGDNGTPGEANGSCELEHAPAITDCSILSPPSFDAPIVTGSAHPVLGRVWAQNVTDLNRRGNDHHPHLEMQLGFGDAQVAPASWLWRDASPDASFTPLDSVEDRMTASLSMRRTGMYAYGFRARLFDLARRAWGEWTYCDQYGIAGDTPEWGTVEVVAP